MITEVARFAFASWASRRSRSDIASPVATRLPARMKVRRSMFRRCCRNSAQPSRFTPLSLFVMKAHIATPRVLTLNQFPQGLVVRLENIVRPAGQVRDRRVVGVDPQVAV